MLHAPEFISKLKRNEMFVCGKKRRTKVKLCLIINYSEGLYKVAYNVYKRIKQH